MKKLSNQKLDNLSNKKGITLIALIITIIIMLILVGVSVSTSLKGGLFDAAKEAVTGTEKQIIYDQILSSTVLTNDGKININSTYETAKTVLETQVKSVSEITDGQFDVEGKNGTYTYTITEDTIIMETE